ncbi:MAG: ferredoxin [Nanoarchaeota archaeon]
MARIEINEEKCIGCGLCEELVPAHFEIGPECKARCKVREISEEDEKINILAQDNCPVQAITIRK